MKGELENIAVRIKAPIVKRDRDWLGGEILLVKVGGREEPPVLVAAGARGFEPAGVYALVHLSFLINLERSVFLLLCRDPTGFNGPGWALSRMLDEDIKPSSLKDLRELLEERCETVDVNGISFALLGNAAIACPDEVVKHEEVLAALRKGASRLEGCRVLIPSMMPGVEGVGEAGRAWSLYVSEGRLCDNDDLGCEELPEASFVRDVLEELEPGLVVDLREGPGSSVVFESPAPMREEEKTMADVAMGQLSGVRVECIREVRDGRLTLASAGKKYGYSVVVRVGWSMDLGQRVDCLLSATLSVINSYALVRL